MAPSRYGEGRARCDRCRIVQGGPRRRPTNRPRGRWCLAKVAPGSEAPLRRHSISLPNDATTENVPTVRLCLLGRAGGHRTCAQAYVTQAPALTSPLARPAHELAWPGTSYVALSQRPVPQSHTLAAPT